MEVGSVRVNDGLSCHLWPVVCLVQGHVKINVTALFAVCFRLTFLGSATISFPFRHLHLHPRSQHLTANCDFPGRCNGSRCNFPRPSCKTFDAKKEKQKSFSLKLRRNAAEDSSCTERVAEFLNRTVWNNGYYYF